MRLKKLCALVLVIACLLSLSACGSLDSQVDDYVDGKSAGKDLGHSSAADAVFTLNYNSSYSMNPLVATIIGFLMLKEMPDAGTYIGGVIIIISVVLFSMKGQKSR